MLFLIKAAILMVTLVCDGSFFPYNSRLPIVRVDLDIHLPG
jgi:hypothetical protein